MAKTKVVLEYSGFNALRKSPEITAGMYELAQGIAQRAGDGYAADTFEGRTKNMASAYTATPRAMASCAKHAGDPLLEAMQS